MKPKRSFLWLLILAIMVGLLAACGGTTETPPTSGATSAPAAEATAAPAAEATAAPAAGSSAGTTVLGDALPADAAPIEYQVYVNYFDNTAPYTTLDFMESVYNRGGTGALNDFISEPLVRLNKDFEIQPAAALKWTSSSDGKTWTFELDPKLMWSDGTPVTADDYVTTFRYAADPKHAWDFAWYFSAPGAIKGWDDAVAGKIPTDQIGVRADGPNKLIFETETPAPFLPAKLLYSTTFQKAHFEKYGPLYNNDPATSVSAGPFILTEWKKGERLVYEANPKYTGTNHPYIQKIISIGAKPETFFAGYQSNEVDFVTGQVLQTADNEIIAADPEMSKEVKTNTQDFRTDYLFFDDQSPPFNDIKVRQAFSHIVDRDALIKNIITPSQGIPAYSFLMPGFPASNSEGLKDIQNYDPAKAKELLSEAGFPNGQGFPKLTLMLRNEPPVRVAVANAIAANIKQELGIDVEVSNIDQKTYMENLNAKPTKIQFGMVSYGIDFLDPSNMLGVWLSGGRHNWNNADYDKLVTDAAASTDTEGRIKQFQDAEKLMVTEAPAVWIYHRLVGDLVKPWVKGDALLANKAGFAGLQWPGYGTFSDSLHSLYIGKEVLDVRTSPPQ